MTTTAPRNSAVEATIRPETLMDELGIKKTAYHGDLKYLGIKPQKDENGKSFLENSEADQLRALRSWVNEHGKRTGFLDSNAGGEAGGELAVMGEEAMAQYPSQSGIATVEQSDLASEFHPPEQDDPCSGIDEEVLYREASEIAAFQMTVPQQVVLAMASQMSYDDLHPQARAKVDQVREAASPKAQPQAIAAQLLTKIRSRSSGRQPSASAA